MIKLVHFADAHIDIATHGRHDPETGLPIRVIDFLKALETIIDTAIAEKVDLVLFSGDAYKDRTPSPTFQREWGRRIIRLPMAGIPVLLLVGNHDISPASGRAHTLQEFDTLQVPNVRVLYKPELLKPADLWGLPLQVIALPWVFRSSLMASLQLSPAEGDLVNEELEKRLTIILEEQLDALDPTLPAILVAILFACDGAARRAHRDADASTDPRADPRTNRVATGANRRTGGVHLEARGRRRDHRSRRPSR